MPALARILAVLALPAATACAADLPLERIKLPPGFAIEVYAEVPGARSLALGDERHRVRGHASAAAR